MLTIDVAKLFIREIFIYMVCQKKLFVTTIENL